MTIETRFKPGDRIYTICSRAKEVSLNAPCPTCNGTGRISLFGQTMPCGSHFGINVRCRLGTLVTLKEMWCVNPVPFFVEQISIEVNEAEEHIIYEEYDYEGCNTIEEAHAFATEEEAQAECDRRNNGN